MVLTFKYQLRLPEYGTMFMRTLGDRLAIKQVVEARLAT